MLIRVFGLRCVIWRVVGSSERLLDELGGAQACLLCRILHLVLPGRCRLALLPLVYRLRHRPLPLLQLFGSRARGADLVDRRALLRRG